RRRRKMACDGVLLRGLSYYRGPVKRFGRDDGGYSDAFLTLPLVCGNKKNNPYEPHEFLRTSRSLRTVRTLATVRTLWLRPALVPATGLALSGLHGVRRVRGAGLGCGLATGCGVGSGERARYRARAGAMRWRVGRE